MVNIISLKQAFKDHQFEAKKANQFQLLILRIGRTFGDLIIDVPVDKLDKAPSSERPYWDALLPPLLEINTSRLAATSKCIYAFIITRAKTK